MRKGTHGVGSFCDLLKARSRPQLPNQDFFLSVQKAVIFDTNIESLHTYLRMHTYFCIYIYIYICVVPSCGCLPPPPPRVSPPEPSHRWAEPQKLKIATLLTRALCLFHRKHPRLNPARTFGGSALACSSACTTITR